MHPWLKLFRVHHWIKNVLIFAGVIFSKSFCNPVILQNAIYTFLAFCCVSSFIYIINDWRDIQEDKVHKYKCNRPLASGVISVKRALLVAFVVGGLGLTIAYFINVTVLVIALSYILLNILYSLWLKNMMLLDVFAISAGFMLRLLAGTLGLGIKPSAWLILCGMMLTLFLGFAKRYVEWNGNNGTQHSRRVLDHYTLPLLDKYLSMTGIASIICYSLYTVDSSTVKQIGSTLMIWSVPPVVFCIFHFLYLVHKKHAGENLSKEIWTNPSIIVSSIVWGATVGLILMFSNV